MFNLFVKPHDQSQACLSSAMARKRRMKSKVVLYARAKARNNMKRVEEVLRKAKKMDVQRVIDSGIPDVAPVFGGVRGRTLSSRHLKYAWPIIAEAGVKTVIDLRNLDSSNRLVEYCEQYGMEFFHYPVDKKKLNTEVMVDRLLRFCELIERGDFYIACAMGLHRTDIALSVYWVFYGADQGLDAPSLRGYTESSGHDTNNIMQVLNAMYNCMTERNGQNPMPEEVFKERKKAINEKSRS